MQITKTGVKAVDDLIAIMNDRSAPRWKRTAARQKFLRIQERHDRIVQAINESEEYPYDTIWGIIKGGQAQNNR